MHLRRRYCASPPWTAATTATPATFHRRMGEPKVPPLIFGRAESESATCDFATHVLSSMCYMPGRWSSFLCVCSVFSPSSIQLHWPQYPPNQTNAAQKWFQTSNGLLGAGPSGTMVVDAIITDYSAMHVASVPIVNPSTVVVWEVPPGLGNGFHATPKISTTNGVPIHGGSVIPVVIVEGTNCLLP
ncbi:mediator of RNA polymerase II transcription subunit 16-like [Pyrus ussuriensis x Pyrus communis]|uniref:Mediator of RNA polymerase II transcription subunit 16-like n=1 Tax=Pyrus ussuriensis x Pyrus communis TaxID=2448454 RepID=A0A5N5GNE7_9ROSA|nr:mediator of RNA polymerase II transcription subunit 16-like [Pyrus ussuriensis x Pyrus communis]